MKIKKGQKNKFFEMKASANNEADVFIYGEITKFAFEDEGEHSAQTFKNALDDLGDVSQINLFVNSPGGSVFEGITIHNMLKRHSAKVVAHVDALAASIASVIIMAADEVRMPSNSMLMIHNPWMLVIGNAAELRKQADDLDRIGESAIQSYLNKAGENLQEDQLREMLDSETWLSADEALEFGLSDVVENSNNMAACIDEKYIQKYKNVPNKLKNEPKNTISAEEKAKRQRISDEAKAHSDYIKELLGGI